MRVFCGNCNTLHEFNGSDSRGLSRTRKPIYYSKSPDGTMADKGGVCSMKQQNRPQRCDGCGEELKTQKCGACGYDGKLG